MRLPVLFLLCGVLTALTVANLLRASLGAEVAPVQVAETIVAQTSPVASGGGVAADPILERSPSEPEVQRPVQPKPEPVERELPVEPGQPAEEPVSHTGTTSLVVENQPVAFEAVPDGDIVRLTWNTVREFHNEGYDVQIAAPGGDFETAAAVPAGGTESEGRGYMWTSESLAPGRYAARLVQRSADGHRAPSAPVRFTIAAPAPDPGTALDLVPGEAGSWQVVSAHTERVHVVLLSAERVPLQTLWSGLAGPTRVPTIEVPEAQLPPGVYRLRAESASGTATRTLRIID